MDAELGYECSKQSCRYPGVGRAGEQHAEPEPGAGALWKTRDHGHFIYDICRIAAVAAGRDSEIRYRRGSCAGADGTDILECAGGERGGRFVWKSAADDFSARDGDGRVSFGIAHAHANSYTDITHADADACIADADTYVKPNAYTYTYTYTHSDSDSDAFAYADTGWAAGR